MKTLAKIEVSKKRLKFIPGNRPDFSIAERSVESEFDVTVINASDKFASFQIELLAEGTDPTSALKWYTVEPEICAKKPPGARTTFHVSIIKAPIPAYDTTINLGVRVFSVEYEALFATENVQLLITRPLKSLKVYLPFQDLEVYPEDGLEGVSPGKLKVHPGSRIKILALVYNLSPDFVTVNLELEGLNPDWFPEGTQQTIQIDAGGAIETEFWCNPPQSSESRSRIYDFNLKATDQKGNQVTETGRVEVLPSGAVNFTCLHHQQTVPAKVGIFIDQRSNTATYKLEFENESNLPQRINLNIEPSNNGRSEWTVSNDLKLDPDEKGEMKLAIATHRPWLGRSRQLFFEVFPSLSNPNSGETTAQIAVKPTSQLLELKVRPIIPFLLQLGCGAFILALLSLLWWLIPPTAHHTAPVNSVRLIANEETVVSGSSDKTIRRWQVNNNPWTIDIRRLRYNGIIAEDAQRAVRVIRQRPAQVAQIAAGLENGEIQLWQISPPSAEPIAVIFERNDRVFDLDFTEDSKYLFSGHGSGMVRQWDLNASNRSPVNELYPNQPFAISALSVSEKPGEPTLVAIAGQFNRLVLWDWAGKVAYNVNTEINSTNTSQSSTFNPVISKNSYINSLAIANSTSNSDDISLMATADNQGVITLWDLDQLRQCIYDSGNISSTPRDQSYNHLVNVTCDDAQIDQWQAGQNGEAVRSVDLSDNGCFLASTGDDGRVMLWTLKQDGKRNRSQGIVLASFPNARLNTVDIQQIQNDTVLVASDAPNNQVRLYRKQVSSNGCQ